MGQSESKDLCQALDSLLREKGVKIKHSSLRKFIDDVDVFAPWFVVSGNLNAASWKKLRKDIDRAQEQGLTLEPLVNPIWQIVNACLKAEEATDLGAPEPLIQLREHLQKAKSVTASSPSTGSDAGEGPSATSFGDDLIPQEGRPPPNNPCHEALTSGSSGESDSEAEEPTTKQKRSLMGWEDLPPPMPSAPPSDLAMKRAPKPTFSWKEKHKFPRTGPLLDLPPGYSTLPQKPSDSQRRTLSKFWDWGPIRPFGLMGKYYPLEEDPSAHMFPVLIQQPVGGPGPQLPNQYQPYDQKFLRELRDSIHKYGPQSQYTLSLLESVGQQHHTPSDVHMIAKVALDSARYLDFKAWYEEFAIEQAERNARGRRPGWNLDMLTGKGQYAQNQTNYPIEVYDQIFRLFMMAWKKLQTKGESLASISSIHQGPTEPFVEFVAKLQEAADKIFADEAAADPLIRQMILENSNPECKTILLQNKKKPTQEWIRLCRGVGGPITAVGLATALAGALQINKPAAPNPGARPKGCFQCGQQGHIKRDCPMGTRKPWGHKPPNPRQREYKDPKFPELGALCPRCQKGPHPAEECRSMFNKAGEKISGPKNGPRGPPYQVGPRFQSHPQSRPQSQSPVYQNQSAQPQGQQDWTSVPPPDSY